MAWRRIDNCFRLAAMALLAGSAVAAEYRGQVTFGGLPVPGATVTATSRGQQAAAITDLQGGYRFADLADGNWSIEIRMQGFAPVTGDVAVAPNVAPAKWELKILPLEQIRAAVQAVPASAPPPPAAAPAAPTTKPAPDEDLAQRAADGFLINGSMRNGAASPFAQLEAFGNNRNGSKGLYNGGIGLILDNSALDARPFSLTGQAPPQIGYNRLTGVAALQGPLQIRRLFQRAPVFFVAYQWTHNNNASSLPALMPDAAQRSGVFPSPVLDPSTGAPFPGNAIPQDRISPQARALLSYYPLPNFAGTAGYNFEVPVVSPMHQDALQSRFNKSLGPKDQVYGRFAFQSTRSDTPNVFGFLDTTDALGINSGVNWSHRLNRDGS